MGKKAENDPKSAISDLENLIFDPSETLLRSRRRLDFRDLRMPMKICITQKCGLWREAGRLETLDGPSGFYGFFMDVMHKYPSIFQ